MKKRHLEDICEESTFTELFKTHSKDLHNFLYYKYGADNNPSDLVQEAFAKLWDNCKKVTFEKVRSFLFTVAKNQMLNDLSKKKTAINYSKHKPKGYTNESPQYLLEEEEYMKRLQNAIEELTEEQRVAFLLNRIEQKKHKEIAEMLGISVKAVEKRIYKALDKLRLKVGKLK